MVLLFVFTYEETNFVSPALLRDSMSVAREAAVVSGEGERDPDAKDLTVLSSTDKARDVGEAQTVVVLNAAIGEDMPAAAVAYHAID